MSDIGKQIKLLLWKEFRLQLRRKVPTIVELFVPMFFAFGLLIVRYVEQSTVYHEPTYFPSFRMDDKLEIPKNLRNETFEFEGITLAKKTTRKIGVFPHTNVTMGIMANIQENLYNNRDLLVIVTYFDDEKAMEDYLTFSDGDVFNEYIYICGISFEGGDYQNTIPKNVTYRLRMQHSASVADGGVIQKSEKSWKTGRQFPYALKNGPRNKDSEDGKSPGYSGESQLIGFVELQHYITRAIIGSHLARRVIQSVHTAQYLVKQLETLNNISTTMRRFPFPPYIDDRFVYVLQTQMPLIIVLSFIYSSLQIPKEIAYEKEKKLKESMKMMGLKNWCLWLAYYIKHSTMMLIIVVLISLIYCPPFEIPFLMPHGKILRHSDPTLVFAFLLVYSQSVVIYAFMISSFFSKGNSAAACGGIIFFLSYTPYTFLYARYYIMSKQTKILWALLMNQAMSMSFYMVSLFEGTGEGIQWNNLYRPLSVDDNTTLASMIGMLILDCFLYGVVLWYVEAVFPGAYGTPKKWYFFLLPSYWCSCLYTVERRLSNYEDGAATNEFVKVDSGYEHDPKQLVAGIKIKNLTKAFNSALGTKVAVNSLNLNMYEGQITALLGHNGAGKTTTMFMLTGFLPPTSGTAFVNGYDIRIEMDNVRSSLGLCPQHDILFDELTVKEHLQFFGRLKGCSEEDLQSQIQYYANTLELRNKLDAPSKSLAGGLKRRLSVGLALIGNSKIVILDEPTAGMDASARRLMWDVLQTQKAGRTMVLSTHFMDEADYLSDRIAIMAEGEIRCKGSSLFLKRQFGAGYHMTIVKNSECEVETLVSLVKHYVSDARVENNIGTELSFTMPHEEKQHFPNMFRAIEERKKELGITAYGVSVTTMEEVFMRVINESSAENKLVQSGEAISLERMKAKLKASARKIGEKNTGITLLIQQLRAMLTKRFLFSYRNLLLVLSQVFLPISFPFIACLIYISQTPPSKSPPLEISLNMFDMTKTVYQFDGDDHKPIAELFKQSIPVSERHTLLEVSDVNDYLVDVAKRSISDYTFQHIAAGRFYNDSNGTFCETLFNAQTYHSPAVAMNLMNNALLKYFVGNEFSINVINHPLPQTPESQVEDIDAVFGYKAMLFTNVVIVGLSFLAASLVVFLITERVTKSKHSQLICGTQWYMFWLSTFIWDIVCYTSASCLLLTLYTAFSIKPYVVEFHGRPDILMLLVFMYGMAVLPTMYLAHFKFDGAATGFVTMTFYNILSGISPLLLVVIFRLLGEEEIADGLEWLFLLILINYNLAQGLKNFWDNYTAVSICFYTVPAARNLPPGKASLNQLCNQLSSIYNSTGRLPLNLPCCTDYPEVCGDFCLVYSEKYLRTSGSGIGRMIAILCFHAIICWMCVCVIETGFLRRLIYKFRRKRYIEASKDESLDDDVVLEKSKILNTPAYDLKHSYPVVVSGLTKYFDKCAAVDRLYLTVREGDCFGLLGVNGAGKTTTFRMLTGDETLSAGTAYMNTHNIRKDMAKVQHSIGYCPQFDALIDQLTGEETLYMYARLRGIPESSIPSVVNNLFEGKLKMITLEIHCKTKIASFEVIGAYLLLLALLLTPHKRKQISMYSGGNKRKLSTAIALIGNPSVVFLDEPTTGMDPIARRMLWEALTQVRKSGKTLILTSHSMDECEVLCTKLAIMVNGRFKCVGSIQHLKAKFGEGYTLIARIGCSRDGSSPNLKRFQEYVTRAFNNAEIKDIHQDMVQYHINETHIKWADIFDKIESVVTEYKVEDYSVSQTSLEQVFMTFARAQEQSKDELPVISPSSFISACLPCCEPETIFVEDKGVRYSGPPTVFRNATLTSNKSRSTSSSASKTVASKSGLHSVASKQIIANVQSSVITGNIIERQMTAKLTDTKLTATGEVISPLVEFSETYKASPSDSIMQEKPLTSVTVTDQPTVISDKLMTTSELVQSMSATKRKEEYSHSLDKISDEKRTMYLVNLKSSIYAKPELVNKSTIKLETSTKGKSKSKSPKEFSTAWTWAPDVREDKICQTSYRRSDLKFAEKVSANDQPATIVWTEIPNAKITQAAEEPKMAMKKLPVQTVDDYKQHVLDTAIISTNSKTSKIKLDLKSKSKSKSPKKFSTTGTWTSDFREDKSFQTSAHPLVRKHLETKLEPAAQASALIDKLKISANNEQVVTMPSVNELKSETYVSYDDFLDDMVDISSPKLRTEPLPPALPVNDNAETVKSEQDSVYMLPPENTIATTQSFYSCQ